MTGAKSVWRRVAGVTSASLAAALLSTTAAMAASTLSLCPGATTEQATLATV
jgi:hypothetical protein